MPKLNLKSMSVADLVALRDRVQEELARKISVERSALEKQIAALTKLEAGKSADAATDRPGGRGVRSGAGNAARVLAGDEP